MGKYVELQDAYKSILESFIHAGVANECKANIIPINSTELNPKSVNEKLGYLDGILVAPGFGDRGIEGKIIACKFSRENKIPFCMFSIFLRVRVSLVTLGPHNQNRFFA